MKILTNKQVNEILTKITVCQIIANESMNDLGSALKMTENLIDICIEIGGCKGTDKVLKKVRKYFEKQVD